MVSLGGSENTTELALQQQKQNGEKRDRDELEDDAPAHQPIGGFGIGLAARHAQNPGEKHADSGQHGQRDQNSEERRHVCELPLFNRQKQPRAAQTKPAPRRSRQ